MMRLRRASALVALTLFTSDATVARLVRIVSFS
jgi:hypothetical protein